MFLVAFPCVGSGPSETWSPSAEQLAAWAAAYPAVNIEHEMLKMSAWILCNHDRRKTYRGYPKFVNTWLSKAQDRGGASPDHIGFRPPPMPPVPQGRTYHSREEVMAELTRLRGIENPTREEVLARYRCAFVIGKQEALSAEIEACNRERSALIARGMEPKP